MIQQGILQKNEGNFTNDGTSFGANEISMFDATGSGVTSKRTIGQASAVWRAWSFALGAQPDERLIAGEVTRSGSIPTVPSAREGQHFVMRLNSGGVAWARTIDHPEVSGFFQRTHAAFAPDGSIIVAGALRAAFSLDGFELTPTDDDFYVAKLPVKARDTPA